MTASSATARSSWPTTSIPISRSTSTAPCGRFPLGIGTVAPVVQQSASGPFASASRCYYWLHVHVQDGVIHVESPTQAKYTLGQFFDEWRQPLSTTQVAGAKGRVTAYLDGKKYAGDPRDITLTSHADIQLDVGTPLEPPQPVDWGPFNSP